MAFSDPEPEESVDVAGAFETRRWDAMESETVLRLVPLLELHADVEGARPLVL